MTEMASFWELWSPYWSYEEDFFLDLESIDKLIDTIRNPVLIIGAGQGLLVEQLQKKGFKVDGVDLDSNMIIYAKKRRGLNLIQANANNMPFADNSYKTSIIATGVVDWLDDEEQIKLIINEVFRITDDAGRVFVAFYKYHSKVEKLLRYTGLITDKGSHRFKRMYEMMKLSCDSSIEFIKAMKNEANIGFFRAILILIKTQMFLPKKEKRSSKKWSKLWKKAKRELDNPESLIECVPELLPYRNEEHIRDLFSNLNIPIHNIFIYDSCSIVQLEPTNIQC